VIKNGPAESFTLLGIQQRLKIRLDFILDHVKGCVCVASTLNRFDQPDFAATLGYTIHDIHDRINNPPREIAADGGEQQLRTPARPSATVNPAVSVTVNTMIKPNRISPNLLAGWRYLGTKRFIFFFASPSSVLRICAKSFHWNVNLGARENHRREASCDSRRISAMLAA